MIFFISDRREQKVVFELSDGRVDAKHRVNYNLVFKDCLCVIESITRGDQFIRG